MSSDDFITADLRGMKAALVARARASGLGLSTIIRTAIARELEMDSSDGRSAPVTEAVSGRAVQVSIRLTACEAAQLAADALRAGASRGAYVGNLLRCVDGSSAGVDHVAALTASCAELATLSRNIYHLATLLGQGRVEAAHQYDSMLASLKLEVRRHLKVVSEALTAWRPRAPGRAGIDRPGTRGGSDA